MSSDDQFNPPAEVDSYYQGYAEESRLDSGSSRLEFERSKEILMRVLPQTPARVVDVGGAGGSYSLWLAEKGYETHLVDASARLVEVARRRSAAARAPIATFSVADARNLPQQDRSADAVLVMGPLYHLPERVDRVRALTEAFRVLKSGGTLVAAAISRFASALDGMSRKLTLDPRFVQIRNRDLQDGQHRNPTERGDYFTTAYFHHPHELQSELDAAGFGHGTVLGVEGPGWMMQDFDERWSDPLLREDLLSVARALEAEPSIIGASAHLLAVGKKA